MRYLLILVLALLCLSLYAQSGPLDQKVTLNYENASLESVLKNISKTYGIKFSYVNNLLPLNQRVTLRVTNQPLRTALDLLFREVEVAYQLVGEQIVLRYAPRKASSQLEAPNPEELTAARTDYRHLRLLPSRGEPRSIALTPVLTQVAMSPPPVYVSSLSERKRWQIWLNQYMNRLESFFQSIEFNRKGELVADSAQRFSDSLTAGVSADDPYWNYAERDFQLTLVTPLGSNGTESANTVNHVSINLLGGLAAGLEGVEFGGLFNAEKDYVHGTQFAGLGNVVGGETVGAQFAGLTNVNRGHVKGAQFAGMTNVVVSPAASNQFAGLANVVVGDNHGTQVAGALNVTHGTITGPQIAGAVNVASGSAQASQIAGALNVAERDARGVQIAGFANIVGNNFQGVQIAGFLNHARRVRGSQIGILNVADSVSGVAIGVLSFVKHGYKRVEVWGSEAFFGNVAFKTGTSRFYNILALGAQPRKDYVRWGFGYGIGTLQQLSRGVTLNLDLVSYHINENQWWTDKLNMLNQAKLLLGLRLSGRTQFIFGPTFNVQVSQLYNAEKGQYGSEIAPWSFYNRTHNDTNVRMWTGFNAGFRF